MAHNNGHIFIGIQPAQVFHVKRPPAPKGYAFGVIHHQGCMTHIECSGLLFLVTPSCLTLSRGANKTGGVTLPMINLQTRFGDLLNRRAIENYSSYYIVGREDKETLTVFRNFDNSDFLDIIKNVRKSAQSR